MRLYSSVHDHFETPSSSAIKMLNILHIHLNDQSDEVTVDVSYMSEGQTIKDFEVFGSDATGRPLRYKVLVSDLQIKHVLYNTGETVEDVPFEEVRIHRKQKVIIESQEMGGQSLGEITKIPICMIACDPQYRHLADKLEQG